jgi:hypothetical protein
MSASKKLKNRSLRNGGGSLKVRFKERPNNRIGADRPSCFFARDYNAFGVTNGSTMRALGG